VTYLANVEDGKRVSSTHQQFRVVLIKSTLVVTDGRSILDDDQVIRVFALLGDFAFDALGGGFSVELFSRFEQQRIGSNHVINNGRLADLLGAELSLGRQVLAVIVSQVVVRRDRQGFDTGVDEELGDNRLELGLTRLEVVTANEGLVSFGELDASGDECVGGGAVDVRAAFEDRGDREQGRGRDFFVRGLDGI
jgi:hypothetical protein